MNKPSRLISTVTLLSFLGGSCPHLYAKPQASDSPMVAMVGFRTMDLKMEEEMRKRLHQELGKSGRVRFIPEAVTKKFVDRLWSEEKHDDASILEKAYQDYLKGKQLYEKLALDEAITKLSSAVRGYREGIGSLRDNRYLLVSHLYLGMALIILGRETEGRKYIREMIVLDPLRNTRKLPQREFSPRIVGLHQKLTAEILNGPNGTLLINTQPAGATIYVDGAKKQRSPVQVADVPTGDHFVVAEKKGHRQFSQRIRVGPGLNKVNIDLKDFQPLAPYAFYRRRDSSVNRQLNKIAKKLGAQILLLGHMAPQKKSKATFTAQFYDARSKEFTKIEKVEASKSRVKKRAKTLAGKLLANLTLSGLVVAEIRDPKAPLPKAALKPPVATSARFQKKGEKSTPIYGKWWFWTIVGVAAAGGAGAFLLLKKSDPSFNILSIQNPVGP